MDEKLRRLREEFGIRDLSPEEIDAMLRMVQTIKALGQERYSIRKGSEAGEGKGKEAV
jgi:hypothetical protein